MCQHLETVIKSRIPGIQSLINKTIAELETELSRLGKPIAADAGVSVLFLFSVWVCAGAHSDWLNMDFLLFHFQLILSFLRIADG